MPQRGNQQRTILFLRSWVKYLKTVGSGYPHHPLGWDPNISSSKPTQICPWKKWIPNDNIIPCIDFWPITSWFPNEVRTLSRIQKAKMPCTPGVQSKGESEMSAKDLSKDTWRIIIPALDERHLISAVYCLPCHIWFRNDCGWTQSYIPTYLLGYLDPFGMVKNGIGWLPTEPQKQQLFAPTEPGRQYLWHPRSRIGETPRDTVKKQAHPGRMENNLYMYIVHIYIYIYIYILIYDAYIYIHYICIDVTNINLHIMYYIYIFIVILA